MITFGRPSHEGKYFGTESSCVHLSLKSQIKTRNERMIKWKRRQNNGEKTANCQRVVVHRELLQLFSFDFGKWERKKIVACIRINRLKDDETIENVNVIKLMLRKRAMVAPCLTRCCCCCLGSCPWRCWRSCSSCRRQPRHPRPPRRTRTRCSRGRGVLPPLPSRTPRTSPPRPT